MRKDLWVLSVFHYLHTCAFPHSFAHSCVNCVGVLQHGNSRRWMDGHPAQRGRQFGLPENVEGVQDGETRQMSAHTQDDHQSKMIMAIALKTRQ